MMDRLPEVEFEGPIGCFYSPSDVPTQALIEGIKECLAALYSRGEEEAIREMLRAAGVRVVQ